MEEREEEEEEEEEAEKSRRIWFSYLFSFGESIDLLCLRHRLGQNGGANGRIFATFKRFYYI